ncbi:glycosyl hydrolase family 18 protein [Halobacterium salinarum]|uniref:Chitinase n=2 Tax=Halobacterium salinarum TaxID=2242 RepID=A0A4D6GWK5_HALS9|nr:glycosyl hydrolase family 18 protein [Halobacterium salinarum]MDL0136541.1 glycosyl hydrolase family 18 protein [Halobacterium salinarum]MDL0144513.1 glycosyl hydrolase family 18 protein [Halobacterium salinarum]QCC44557.1 chitinase [Halobacterium salinarum]TYO76396.1 chitinase family 18 [Halobacterium salinarum DSM 3754]
MPHDRRSYLRTSSAVIASLLAASTPTSAADTPPEWDPDTVYTDGDQATFDGYVWEAKWWTKGDKPGADEWGPWNQLRPVDDSPTDPGGPTASFTTSESVIEPETTVTVDASNTVGDVDSYEWAFGDGTTASGVTASHTYDAAGEYTIELTVTTGDGTIDTTSATLLVADGGAPADGRVVGYYMQWAQWDRDYFPGDIPLDKVTHVNYAFLTVREDGAVDYIQENAAMRVLEPKSWHDHTGFDDLVDDPDTAFLFSIGGWNDSTYFSNAAQSQASRERFADTAIEIMRTHNFDGLDIDWEYPGGGGNSGNVVRDGDKQRYTELLQTVREKLDVAEDEDGKRYQLTTALSADPEKNTGLDHAANAEALDFLNVMTYDYHGAFNDYTNHQAPLYGTEADPSPNADEFYVDASMSFWLDTAFDPAQLSLGLPFYGRSFGNVASSDNNGLYQPFDGTPDGTWGQDNGIKEYWDITQNLAPSSDYETFWDDTAKVPWLYSPSKNVLVSYDSPRSVEAKTAYAAQHDIGGMMFWTFSGDKNEVLLDTVRDAWQ